MYVHINLVSFFPFMFSSLFFYISCSYLTSLYHIYLSTFKEVTDKKNDEVWKAFVVHSPMTFKSRIKTNKVVESLFARNL